MSRSGLQADAASRMVKHLIQKAVDSLSEWKGISKDALSEYVAEYRRDNVLPPHRLGKLLKSVFSTTLRREAVSITNCFVDGLGGSWPGWIAMSLIASLALLRPDAKALWENEL